MNRLIIFPLLLLSFAAFGQEKNDTLSSKQRRFSIGINISPDYCYRTLTKNDKSLSDSIWHNAKNLEDSIEIPKFGYTGGINFGYDINNRLSVEIGIHYSNKGYKTIPFPTVYNWDEDPALATNILSFTYLDFPLRANYLFLKKRFQIIVSAGATLNQLLQVSVKTIPETPTATFQTMTNVSHYDYKKTTISPTISIGAKYKLNERMNLRIEPTYRYAILNINDKSYRATHLWSFGLNIGYYCQL